MAARQPGGLDSRRKPPMLYWVGRRPAVSLSQTIHPDVFPQR